MKFGASLGRRSIPQWAHYNVDYDEIKGLIKEKTSQDVASPVSIPGQDAEPESWKKFEDELFDLLHDQHRRVSLFAKSKYGEIERRIAQLGKQVAQLDEYNSSAGQGRRPLQHTRKFSRLVQEAESIGDQIQALARYTVTQRLAFKKILKKYQKWTGSPGLAERFNKEVLHRSDTALQPNFAPPLDHLSDIQSILRELSTADSQVKHDNKTQAAAREGGGPKSDSRPVASRFHDISETGSDLDFDVALATLPLGQIAGRACYWIPMDSLVEVRVLLLRHMRDLAAKSRAHVFRTSSLSSLSSRHASIKHDGSESPKPNETVQVALFDDLPKFLKEQSGATFSQAEEAPGAIPEKAALSVYWTEDSHAMVVTLDRENETQDHSPPSAHVHKKARTLSVKRKNLPCLLQSDQATSKRVVRSPEEETSAKADNNIQDARRWLAQHPQIRPLAELQATRTRLEGLNNSDVSGVWAVLDTNIIMSSIDTALLGKVQQTRWIEASTRAAGDQARFPHAVLDIRWESGPAPDLINILNQSHLVERVRGFSLETHAVVTVCKPQKMPQPFWMPLLERDIRKIPPAKIPTTRQSLGREAETSLVSRKADSSSAPSTTEGPSGSGFSAGPMNSSATSARDSATESPPVVHKETKKSTDPKLSRIQKDPEPTPVQRYWNEFDDGEEQQEDEAYTIFIDPNAPSGFPGAETASKLWVAASEKTALGMEKLKSLLKANTKSRSDLARQPLLGGHRAVSYSAIDDTSDSDEEAAIAEPSAALRRRSTVLSRTNSRQKKQRKSRERAVFMTYIGCFVASFTLLIVSSILQATGRHKAELEVDLGVVVGVVMGLSFGVIGTSLVMLRKEKLGLLHRAAVFLAFAIICIASGVCLALLIHPAV